MAEPPAPAPSLARGAGIRMALGPRATVAAWFERWGLWALLVALVIALLGTLVWLAGRFEAIQWQEKLERDTAEAASEMRAGLTRNVQSLQALQPQARPAALWTQAAQSLLRERREMVRLEWRDTQFAMVAQADSSFQPPALMARVRLPAEAVVACSAARRSSAPAYGASYFVPNADTGGLEALDMCLPASFEGQFTGYLIVTYGLSPLLAELISAPTSRGSSVAFTEADGTRLAMLGPPPRGDLRFFATHLLDLPGNTLVLRMDRGRAAPSLFPNVLTALVTALALALVLVLILFARDLRRRLRAEGELAQALGFRKAMEDSLVTGLRARDLSGQITYVNPAFCAMVGFSSAELLGSSSPAPYWPGDLVAEYSQRQALRFAGNSSAREGFETVFARKNGERFPARVIEAPLIDTHGQHAGWMSTVLDVSEQRRAEELSRASQDRLQATARLATVGEMASLLSHELNQPLAAISSYATGAMNLLANNDRGYWTNGQNDSQNAVLASPPTVDPVFVQALQRIAEQAERAGKVIRSVNDFVRRRERVREPVSPQALIDAVLPLVDLQARKTGVTLQVQVAPDLGHVDCDRTLVEQVLLNLTRNGIQAMQEPQARARVLTIKAQRAASKAGNVWVEFSVTDTGVGIPQAVAAQLFTAFFTTKTDGMGLGLSLCRTVVEQHGGALIFAPNSAGGTVFIFTLPSAAAAVPK